MKIVLSNSATAAHAEFVESVCKRVVVSSSLSLAVLPEDTRISRITQSLNSDVIVSATTLVFSDESLSTNRILHFPLPEHHAVP